VRTRNLVPSCKFGKAPNSLHKWLDFRIVSETVNRSNLGTIQKTYDYVAVANEAVGR